MKESGSTEKDKQLPRSYDIEWLQPKTRSSRGSLKTFLGAEPFDPEKSRRSKSAPRPRLHPRVGYSGKDAHQDPFWSETNAASDHVSPLVMSILKNRSLPVAEAHGPSQARKANASGLGFTKSKPYETKRIDSKSSKRRARVRFGRQQDSEEEKQNLELISRFIEKSRRAYELSKLEKNSENEDLSDSSGMARPEEKESSQGFPTTDLFAPFFELNVPSDNWGAKPGENSRVPKATSEELAARLAFLEENQDEGQELELTEITKSRRLHDSSRKKHKKKSRSGSSHSSRNSRHSKNKVQCVRILSQSRVPEEIPIERKRKELKKKNSFFSNPSGVDSKPSNTLQLEERQEPEELPKPRKQEARELPAQAEAAVAVEVSMRKQTGQYSSEPVSCQEGAKSRDRFKSTRNLLDSGKLLSCLVSKRDENREEQSISSKPHREEETQFRKVSESTIFSPTAKTDNIVARAFKDTKTTRSGIYLKNRTDGAVVVSKITKGGLFSKSPITPGDEITNINNVPCHNMSAKQVADLIRCAEGEVVVNAKRAPFVKEVVSSTLPFFSVTVTKDARSRRAGLECHVDEQGRVFVSGIRPKGLFSATALQVGDEIISINSIECKGMNPSQLFNIFHRAEGAITLWGRRSSDHTVPSPPRERVEEENRGRDTLEGLQSKPLQIENREDLGQKGFHMRDMAKLLCNTKMAKKAIMNGEHDDGEKGISSLKHSSEPFNGVITRREMADLSLIPCSDVANDSFDESCHQVLKHSTMGGPYSGMSNVKSDASCADMSLYSI